LEARDRGLGPALRRLTAALTSPAMADWLEAATGHGILSRPEIVAHRMRAGDYVGFHNDFRAGGERLRGVIYLADEARNAEDGAFIALGDDPGRVLAVVRPLHNRMLVFRTSRSSNHLVTEVEGPDRFSINFAWY
jgi:Rps23 Pro-64 3,4-dihydroxylase Tpa1-like proline 4-hydroxylase